MEPAHYESEQDREEAERIQALLTKKPVATPGIQSRDISFAQVENVAAKALPYFDVVLKVLATVLPYGAKGWQMVEKATAFMPEHAFDALYGLTLCFFGGQFAASIAAVEAFKLCGWSRTKLYLKDLAQDFATLKKAHLEDDKLDADNNGVADVLEMDTKDKVHRKLKLYFQTIDPNRVVVALGGIYQGLAGVISTLQFKFAKTVTLGISIGNLLRKPAGLYLAPILVDFVPKSHQKWIPFILSYACKTIAVSIAWWIQQQLSIIQSAMTGGVHFSRAALKLAQKKGILTEINEAQSMLDEYVGYGFAALGIYMQMWIGLNLSFPFSLVLWPLLIVEYILRWLVGR